MADEQQQDQQTGGEQTGEQTGEQPGEQKATYTAEEVEALVAEQTKGMKAKLDELMGETKSAKQKARELEEQKEQEERDRLKQQQEYQTLWEREQEEKNQLKSQFEEYQQRVQQAEIKSASNALAGELTRDAKRAALLAEKATAFAEYDADGKVVYKMNGVDVGKEKITEHLRAEYPFLVDGNQSNGGGAAGNLGGIGDASHKNPDAEKAAKSRDLNGFLQASISQNMKR